MTDIYFGPHKLEKKFDGELYVGEFGLVKVWAWDPKLEDTSSFSILTHSYPVDASGCSNIQQAADLLWLTYKQLVADTLAGL